MSGEGRELPLLSDKVLMALRPLTILSGYSMFEFCGADYCWKVDSVGRFCLGRSLRECGGCRKQEGRLLVKVFWWLDGKILADAHGDTVGKDLACGASNRCQSCLVFEKVFEGAGCWRWWPRIQTRAESTKGRRAEESRWWHAWRQMRRWMPGVLRASNNRLLGPQSYLRYNPKDGSLGMQSVEVKLVRNGVGLRGEGRGLVMEVEKTKGKKSIGGGLRCLAKMDRTGNWDLCVE